MIGGPNPDGNYYLAMIRGDRAYRITGTRGTSAYFGLQILAGTGLTPRRMAGYLSDVDLALKSGEFTVVLAAREPADSDGAQWLPIPADASAVVVREYIGDPAAEELATLRIEALDPDPVAPLTDEELGDQFTAMAWTLMKLTTLHRTIKPELLDNPNTLLTAEAADLGAADTTPDNLYMIGTFRLEPGQALVLDIAPPDTRYWNVTLESIWHECLEPRRRHSSVTNRAVRPDPDGRVRIAISAADLGFGHWLDTGGRQRGFVVLRWLDNPDRAGRAGVCAAVRPGTGGTVVTTLHDRFNPERLIATACEEAGSDDFGADGWQPGLALVADGLVSEAKLSAIGVEIAHLDLMRALKNRLDVIAWRKQHPEIAVERN